MKPWLLQLLLLLVLSLCARGFQVSSSCSVFAYAPRHCTGQQKDGTCGDVRGSSPKGTAARRAPKWFMTKEGRHTRNSKVPKIAKQHQQPQTVQEHMEPMPQLENTHHAQHLQETQQQQDV